MKLTNAKLFFLSCIVMVFVAGYARDNLYGFYSSAKSHLISSTAGISTSPAEGEETDNEDSDVESNPTAKIAPPIEGRMEHHPPSLNSNNSTNPAKRTGDIGAALEGVGPGGLDNNMVNQRQEYLKNLNAQLREQHGGVMPTTTTTTAPQATPPVLPNGIAPPPSPDLLPQIAPPPSAVPGANPPGWAAPPPLINQPNTPVADDDEDEVETEVGDDEDLETDEDAADDADDSADDADSDNAVE